MPMRRGIPIEGTLAEHCHGGPTGEDDRVEQSGGCPDLAGLALDELSRGARDGNRDPGGLGAFLRSTLKRTCDSSG